MTGAETAVREKQFPVLWGIAKTTGLCESWMEEQAKDEEVVQGLVGGGE